MWADINGERKKVACGPCIRGHRSSKCDHRDRVLVEVRKPGRPLSSCPHPSGSCSCERVVINYTIPKTSECACPSEKAQHGSASTNGGRVQKSRNRKSTASINPAVLEKALKSNQDGETDSSSLLTQTPTSESNDASLPSSASSTPRIVPSRKESRSSDMIIAESSNSTSRPATSHSQTVSSCCQPKPVQPQGGSCCSSKTVEQSKPAPPKKSCCSGSTPTQPTQPQLAHPTGQPNPSQNYGNFQYMSQVQHRPYGMINQGNNYMPMPPFNFNTPIYNHAASVYQPPTSMPMAPMGSHVGSHAPEHNCHCGDSCSCFGCAAHPNNATMMEYVRSMHHFMSTGQFGAIPPPTYDLPSYPHHAGYGAEASLGYNNTPPPNFLAAHQMNFQAAMQNAMAMQQTPVHPSSPWSQSTNHTPVQAPPSIDTQYFSNTSVAPSVARETSVSPKAEESIKSPTFADSPTESKDEDAATLSPSSYFWQEVVLPGCNDATGTCQCGDGCECVGCLTHGGHNGVPLEIPATDEADAFPDFTSPTDMAQNGSNQITPFSTAPT